MKKLSFLLASIVLFGGMITISSCSKTDTTSPVVTLTNDDATHNRVAQFSITTYVDPGSTVTDDIDKSLVATVAGTVNMLSAGDYPLVYTATDKAGNKGTATRTVTVDGGMYLAGSFNAEDFDASNVSQGTYTETCASSTITTNKINFTKFAFYTNGSVYGTCSGTTITIPQQTVTCGSVGNVADRTFTGSGTYSSANRNFTINYSETTNSTTVTGHDTYSAF